MVGQTGFLVTAVGSRTGDSAVQNRAADHLADRCAAGSPDRIYLDGVLQRPGCGVLDGPGLPGLSRVSGSTSR